MKQLGIKSLVSENHRQVIKAHLKGNPVGENQLWLSVGYFYSGAGQFLPKPVSPAEWDRLLKETGRK